jgi:hypothetical protein
MKLIIILSTKLICLMFEFWRAGGANACPLALSPLRPGQRCRDSVRLRVREPEQFHRGIPDSIRMHGQPLF